MAGVNPAMVNVNASAKTIEAALMSRMAGHSLLSASVIRVARCHLKTQPTRQLSAPLISDLVKDLLSF
jgi:hypothetical protein